VYLDRSLETFPKNVLSSGTRSQLSKQKAASKTFCFLEFWTLKTMEVYASEMSVNPYQTTLHNIPGDSAF
jgi:hypothetical protein